MKKITILLVQLCLFAYVELGGAEHVKDQLVLDDVFDVDYVVLKLCKNEPGVQLSRVSTILSIDDESLNKHGCSKKTKETLNALKVVLETSNDNVCSQEKVSAIKHFSKKFIHKSKLMRSRSTTEMLDLFFKHYVLEISSICKKSLLTNLHTTIENKFTEEDYKFGGSGVFDRLVNNMGKYLGKVNSDNHFDDVILVWDVIFGSSKKNKEIDDYVDRKDGNVRSLNIRLNGDEAIDVIKMQYRCINQFKPVYSKLILPVLRLAYLGYSARGVLLGDAEQQMREDPMVKRWYTITQVCETILPIKFFFDPALPRGSIALMLKEQASQLTEMQAQIETPEMQISLVQFEPTTNSIRLDKLESVNTLPTHSMIDLIRSSKTTKLHASKRVLKNLAIDMKKTLKEGPKKLLVIFKKNNGKKDTFETKPINEIVDPSTVDKSNEEIIRETGIELNETSTRRKRECGPVIFTVMLLALIGICLFVAIITGL